MAQPADLSLTQLFPIQSSPGVSVRTASLASHPHSLPLYQVPAPPSSDTSSSLRRQHRSALSQKNDLGHKIVIFMVGLPARGKSYICQKLSRYLAWCGYQTRVFNVGNKRRTKVAQSPSMQPIQPAFLSDSKLSQSPSNSTAPKSAFSPKNSQSQLAGTAHDASFFDPDNVELTNLRNELALEVLDELLQWINEKGGKVGIHDATNSTLERRKLLLERVERDAGPNVKVMFIESICTDPQIIASNILMKTKSPDYSHLPTEVAIHDFTLRMKNYEHSYVPIGDAEENNCTPFIKIFNVGRKVVAANVKGYLQSQCVFYLMQIHIKPRTIWLTRHGQSVYNLHNRIGGDPPLTANGRKYGAALTKFMKKQYPSPNQPTQTTRRGQRRFSLDIVESDEVKPLTIWTSTLKRTIETVAEFGENDEWEVKHVRQLDELYAGVCENLTYKEIERNYPAEYAARQLSKLTYRYPGPGGESYMDVIERLRPIIIELERCETNVLIVTHNVVMRTLLAYFTGISLEEMPKLDIPINMLYRIDPKPYGADLTKYSWNEEKDEFIDVGNSA